jgi:hypothetical protein
VAMTSGPISGPTSGSTSGQASGSAPEPGEAIATLRCGRDAAVVWDRAEAGLAPDEHERGCPHCGAAFADAAGLHSVVHRMAAEPLELPGSVLGQAMQAVRTQFHSYDVLALASPAGPVRLSRPAAAAVLRHAVDRMSGVSARSCRIEQDPGGASDAAPTGADITITVAARFGVELASVTARVRQMVIAAGEQALGMPVRRVDIDVVDVIEDRRP